MRLRHQADARTLIWTLVFFPAVPAIGFIDPQLAPWLFPVALYLAYISGVLTHYHNHLGVFVSKRANKLYGMWLSLFYGYPIFVWIPTHNQNHHRYNNGPGDATRTDRYSGRDSLWNLLSYPFRSAVWQAEGIKTYIATAKDNRPERYREMMMQYAVVIGGHLSLLTLAVVLHGPALGLITYLLMAGIPAGFASWSMMFTNYVQHVGCDYESPDNHSRNFVSAWQNWLVFDAGFHTVHHEKPGAHWSEYRKLHEARAAAIDPVLNQNSIFGFCFKRYVLGAAPPLRPQTA